MVNIHCMGEIVLPFEKCNLKSLPFKKGYLKSLPPLIIKRGAGGILKSFHKHLRSINLILVPMLYVGSHMETGKKPMLLDWML